MCEYVSPEVEKEWENFIETAARDLADRPSDDLETYVFEILIPMLSQLFRQIGEQGGHKLISKSGVSCIL